MCKNLGAQVCKKVDESDIVNTAASGAKFTAVLNKYCKHVIDAKGNLNSTDRFRFNPSKLAFIKQP